MNLVHLILVVLALIVFLLAAMGIIGPRIDRSPDGKRGDLTALGLFLWLLSTLIAGGPK